MDVTHIKLSGSPPSAVASECTTRNRTCGYPSFPKSSSTVAVLQLTAVRTRCSSILLALKVANRFAISVSRPIRMVSRIIRRDGTSAMAITVVAATNSNNVCPDLRRGRRVRLAFITVFPSARAAADRRRSGLPHNSSPDSSRGTPPPQPIPQRLNCSEDQAERDSSVFRE